MQLREYSTFTPSYITNGRTMFTLTDSGGTDLSGVNISGGVAVGAMPALEIGDVISLLTNSNGITVDSTTVYGMLSSGISMDYLMDVERGDENTIIARITSVSNGSTSDNNYLKSQTEGIVQPQAEVTTLVNTGTDKLMEWLPVEDSGFEGEVGSGEVGTELGSEVDTESTQESAAEEASTAAEEIQQVHVPNGFEVFANMGVGSIKTKTGNGSYIKSKSSNYDLGFARSFKTNSGLLSLAPVVEYGTGSYDSYLGNGIHGRGDSKYVAGGLIGRMMNNSGFYYEGSFRAGRSEIDFASNDFNVAGVPNSYVTYKSHAPVFSTHAKLGHLLRMDRNNLLDVYAVYFYTRQNAMNAHLSSGETYHFSSTDGSRVRLGYKMTSRVSTISRLYMGMAWQYESNGDSYATYKERKTPSSGMSGSSGMLELGWQVKPIKNNPWMLDINTTGWVGKQEGVTAMAKIKKAF